MRAALVLINLPNVTRIGSAHYPQPDYFTRYIANPNFQLPSMMPAQHRTFQRCLAATNELTDQCSIRSAFPGVVQVIENNTI
jgi:hypothetical protein